MAESTFRDSSPIRWSDIPDIPLGDVTLPGAVPGSSIISYDDSPPQVDPQVNYLESLVRELHERAAAKNLPQQSPVGGWDTSDRTVIENVAHQRPLSPIPGPSGYRPVPYSPPPGPSGYRPHHSPSRYLMYNPQPDVFGPVQRQSTYTKDFAASLADKAKEWDNEKIAQQIAESSRVAYANVWETDDINVLKTWVKNNYPKLALFGQLITKLKNIIFTFATEEQKKLIDKWGWNLYAVINVIYDLLEFNQKKLAVLDISYDFSQEPEQTIAIEKSKQKMLDVIGNLQSVIKKQQQEIALMKNEVSLTKELQSKLEGAKMVIKHMEERDKYVVEDPQSKAEFMRDMEYRLATQEHLSSSLREELQRERISKKEMEDLYMELQAQRLRDHYERMKDFDEANKYLEMQEVIKEAIIPQIKKLTVKPAKVEKAVNEWLRITKMVLKDKRKDLGRLHEELRDLGRQLALIECQKEERMREIQTKTLEIENAKTLSEELTVELEENKEELQDLRRDWEEQDFQRRRGGYKKMSTLKRGGRVKPQRLFKVSPIINPGVPEGQEVPEMLRASSTSPEDSNYFDESLSIHMTPPRMSPHSPSLPRDINVKITPPSLIGTDPRLSEVTSPCTFTPLQGIPLPGTPSLRTSSDATHFPATPYPGTSYERTPRPGTPFPGTPFVSKSGFEFTDPDTVVYRPSLDDESPFSKTIVLTSPKRSEPLFVNIGVDPKPLQDTESGECFSCDISLDVQPGKYNLPAEIRGSTSSPQFARLSGSPERAMSDSPVIKGRRRGRYNIPPDITPTSTRRHGLFTPRGIFKKGQFNIRRIPGRSPISELPWSPIYHPEYARSPASPFPPSPYWSDRSVSWEHSDEKYGGLSPSPVIKGPTLYRSPGSRGSSPSPIIKGPSYRWQVTDSDPSSPSPVIKGPSYRWQLTDSDPSSPSPVIKGPSYRSQYTDSDRSTPSFSAKFSRDSPFVLSSPLFPTPPSGYQSELEKSGTPQITRTYDDDRLNRRWQLNNLFPSAGRLDRSSYSPLYQTFGSRPSSHYTSYQEDPLNRRMQLSGLFESSKTPEYSFSPQMAGIDRSSPTSLYTSYQEDPLNRRMQLSDLFESNRVPEHSFSQQIPRIDESGPSSHHNIYQEDPLNRRMPLSGLFGSSRT